MVEWCPHCGIELPEIPFKDKVVGYRKTNQGYEPEPKRFLCECGKWYHYRV